jgi:hypothetical protein
MHQTQIFAIAFSIQGSYREILVPKDGANVFESAAAPGHGWWFSCKCHSFTALQNHETESLMLPEKGFKKA